MAKRYWVPYPPLFWDDLERAGFCIRDALKDPAVAERLLDRAEEAVREHAKAPAVGQVSKTSHPRPEVYYRFAVGTHMAFHMAIDDGPQA